MIGPRVLISTITPVSGGVPAMTGFIAHTLRDKGFEPVLAHYEPYSVSPHLSVPSFRLLRNRVGAETRRGLEDYETHAIGAWLPELEFTHYLATAHWRRVIASCAAHVTVAGNALAAMPYRQTGRPFLAWLATDWQGDRKDRVAHFPWPRKLLDRMVNAPVLHRLERRVLSKGSILALSEYTRRALDRIAGAPVTAGVLPMPVDADFFSARPEAVAPGRIGFSGRLDDPRKNLELLLATLARIGGRGPEVTALLIGGTPDEAVRNRVRALGLEGRVEFLPYLSHPELRNRLRTLDMFALPSHQEGLCIAALEAMACGCPVVSTRCGGPEEFVIDDETGFLVDFDPGDMAFAISRIVTDRALRARLAAGARRRVEQHYTRAKAETVFWNAFDRIFPHLVQ